jgi:hypothetical protein
LRAGILEVLGVDIRTKSRKREIVDARIIFYELLRQYYPRLGVGGGYITLIPNKRGTFSTQKGIINTKDVAKYLGITHAVLWHYKKAFENLQHDSAFMEKYKAVYLLEGISQDKKLAPIEQEIRDLRERLHRLEEERQFLIDLRYEKNNISK